MADHGTRTNTNTETSTMIGTMTMPGSAGTDTSIAFTEIAMSVLRDGATVKRRVGATAGSARAGQKYGCRTYVYQGRPHYYYEDEGGRIIVRRPIVEVHGSVIIH